MLPRFIADAVAAEPTGHLAAGAKEARRHARAIVVGLDGGLDLSGRDVAAAGEETIDVVRVSNNCWSSSADPLNSPRWTQRTSALDADWIHDTRKHYMRLITPIALLVAPLCAARGQTPAQLSGRLDWALTALESRGFSGVVRVEKDGATLLTKGYGLAIRADRIPFTPATVVQIGSNTKDFTVVALLQLQERGRLDVTDSIGKYFRHAPADKRGITLWQLVTHRAGFPIGLGGDFEPLSRAQVIDQAMKRPLSFPPGTRQSYSNTGYSLLAAIIEQVSGKTYDEYVRDNILAPLHLQHTGLLLPGFDPRLVAHGYRGGEDQGTMVSKPHAADGPYWNLRGNGGMLSTVEDMHAFYKALFETETLLKPATRKLRFDPAEPVALAGSDLVSSFVYERDPIRRIEIILASNTAEWRERPVREAIVAALGLPLPGGGRPVATSGPKTNLHPPAAAVVTMLSDYVHAINTADSTALVRFVVEHFLIEPGSPSAEQRVARMLMTHANLGVLTIVTLDQVDTTTVEMSMTSAVEGALTMKVVIDGGGVPRIRGIQVLVGG